MISSFAVDIVNCVLCFSQARLAQMDQINAQQKEQADIEEFKHTNAVTL